MIISRSVICDRAHAQEAKLFDAILDESRKRVNAKHGQKNGDGCGIFDNLNFVAETKWRNWSLRCLRALCKPLQLDRDRRLNEENDGAHDGRLENEEFEKFSDSV